MVRTEVRAGRLHWSYDAVVNLMIPYPKSMDEDRLLKLCHDAGYDEGNRTPRKRILGPVIAWIGMANGMRERRSDQRGQDEEPEMAIPEVEKNFR